MDSSWVLPLNAVAALGFAASAHLRPRVGRQRAAVLQAPCPQLRASPQRSLWRQGIILNMHDTVFNPLEGISPIQCGGCNQMHPRDKWDAREKLDPAGAQGPRRG